MINSGRGYSKYKKLSGTVRFGKEPDLLVGINTDFLSELEVGMQIMFGLPDDTNPLEDSPSLIVEGFQSQKEIFFKGEVDPTLLDQELSVFTYGTKIIVKGGYDTAAGAINVRNGDQLSFGFLRRIRTDQHLARMDSQPTLMGK